MKNYIAFAECIENLKSLKYSSSKNHQFLLLFAVSGKMKMKKFKEEEESIEILEIIYLIKNVLLLICFEKK